MIRAGALQGGLLEVDQPGVAEVSLQQHRGNDGDFRPGIPDEMKGKIFERMTRGETRAKGTGLGLYLVKTLVKSFSGKVLVEDRVTGDHTRGSRFVVRLPAV